MKKQQKTPTQPKKPRPTVTVAGSAVEFLPPQRGQLSVELSASSPHRENAWNDFNDQLSRLTDAVGSSGELINPTPVERNETDEKYLRNRETTFVSTTVKIEFEVTDFATLLTSLVQAGFTFTKPWFTHTTDDVVSAELQQRAAEDGRTRVEAIAAGLNCTVGRLVTITINGTDQSPARRPSRSVFDNLTKSTFFLQTTLADPISLSEDHFKFLPEEVDTKKITASVIVEYELLEIPATAA